MALLIFLISLIVITGFSLLLITIETTITIIINKIKNKKAFDRQRPVGCTFSTKYKQEFPYGKWEFLGKDQSGFYIYERIK